MDPLANRVARRFGFKFEPKESKQSKVDRLMRRIREETGLSRSVSTDLADALVRGRDVEGLALQKGWPIDGRAIVGPQGSVDLTTVRSEI